LQKYLKMSYTIAGLQEAIQELNKQNKALKETLEEQLKIEKGNTEKAMEIVKLMKEQERKLEKEITDLKYRYLDRDRSMADSYGGFSK